jgi:signal peptidase
VVGEEKKASRIPKKYESVVLFLRDAAIAVLFVAIVLIAMFAYTGLWPPLVVVESDSMMHSPDNISSVGTIDTGDLVLVKRVDAATDVQTYVKGLTTGHKTYGDYGDVVIYKRGGSDTTTPIIHRAIIYLEFDAVSSCYRAPSLQDLPNSIWYTSNASNTWDKLNSNLFIRNVGYNNLTVTIDVGSFVKSQRSGFVTKGDHNIGIDQQFTSTGPVDIEWVVGKARGEIPWFGLLKLWSTGTLGSPAPDNSERNLWIALALIIVTPIIIDVLLTFREKRSIAVKKKAEPTPTRAEAEEKTAEAEGLGKVTRPPRRF